MAEGNGALEALRERLAELSDLEMLGRLAAWDQRTMMPPDGAPARGLQLATLERIAHERSTAPELGGWRGAPRSDAPGGGGGGGWTPSKATPSARSSATSSASPAATGTGRDGS